MSVTGWVCHSLIGIQHFNNSYDEKIIGSGKSSEINKSETLYGMSIVNNNWKYTAYRYNNKQVSSGSDWYFQLETGTLMNITIQVPVRF